MRTKTFYFIFLLFCVYACTNNKEDNTKHRTENALPGSPKLKPGSTYQDTLRIKNINAVFFSPDPVQLGKIRSVTDSIVFVSNQHDCFFQMRNSSIVIKKYYRQVKIVEAKNVRYLLFEMKNGTKEIIDLDSNYDPCGVYLFNGIKKPVLADMPNIETALDKYFKQ